MKHSVNATAINSFLEPVYNWFDAKGWRPWPFQESAWQLTTEGKSGLISVPTGSGKTYAAFLGPMAQIAASPSQKGLKILYVSPLRALTSDIEHAIQRAIDEIGWKMRVESRTGDTKPSSKRKQKLLSPDILLTTPESLSILLTDPSHREFFQSLKYVIIDEWHELLASKRGVLLELSLSHLRGFLPALSTWALSATLKNLEEAAKVAIGNNKVPFIVHSELDRPIIIDSLTPTTIKGLPWAGFLGLTLLPLVLKVLDSHKTTMIFVNVRSQAERWYHAIIYERPEWKNKIAIHHSSIDKQKRQSIEAALKSGELSFIICTSSLDLGIDFPTVEQVIQIGSCKSISRLMQRAGRASHRPMTPCHIYLIPSHALELAEMMAIRKALADKQIESRLPLVRCFDVLFQHLTTLSVGGGFSEKDTFKEIKSTHAFADLTLEEYRDVLDHLVSGGTSLEAYPDYQKLVIIDGLYHIKNRTLASRHRMQIGTITSDTSVTLKFLKGKSLGTIEESFLARLKPGQSFSFGGKVYKLVQMADLTAYVRLSHSKDIVVPTWLGSSFPISPSLADYVRWTFDQFSEPCEQSLPEAILLKKVCHLQNLYSVVPKKGQCLVEVIKSREGWHYFFYPFEGKGVHEALASLFAYRLSNWQPATLQIAVSDYGFEILSSKKLPLNHDLLKDLLSSVQLLEDLKSGINLNELAKSRFRDISRIGGLVFSGFFGQKKTQRQLQVSSSLLFEVFLKYEPNHLLLRQAFDEVLNEQIEIIRLFSAIERLQKLEWIIKEPPHQTPFSLPLYVTAMWHQISSEDLRERIERITQGWIEE